MIFNYGSIGSIDYGIHNPLLVYGWQNESYMWFPKEISCTCWAKDTGRVHYSDCDKNVLREDELNVGYSLPKLSEVECGFLAKAFPPSLLSIAGCDVVDGKSIQSYPFAHGRAAVHYVRDVMEHDYWCSSFQSFKYAEHSNHAHMSICIDDIQRCISLEGLYQRFGKGSEWFSVTILGSITVTIGFHVSQLVAIYPVNDSRSFPVETEFYFYSNGQMKRIKSYDRFKPITPAKYYDFENKTGCSLGEIITSYSYYDVYSVLDGVMLWIPKTVIPQEFLYNFITFVARVDVKSYRKFSSSFNAVKYCQFTAMELMACSDKPSMYCTPVIAYRQFATLVGLSVDDERFYDLSEWEQSFSNPCYVETDLKSGASHHSKFKCSVCPYNKRVIRSNLSQNSQRSKGRMKSTLGSYYDEIKSYDQNSEFVVSITKPSYGFSLGIVVNMENVQSFLDAYSVNGHVNQRICKCFYVGKAYNDDHVCSFTPLRRGVPYSIHLVGDSAMIKVKDVPCARIYPQIIDVVCERGAILKWLSKYFKDFIPEPDLSVSSVSGLLNRVSTVMFDKLFPGKSNDWVLSRFGEILRYFIFKEGTSVDYYSFMKTFDDWISDKRMEDDVVRSIVYGILAIEVGVYSFLDGYNMGNCTVEVFHKFLVSYVELLYASNPLHDLSKVYDLIRNTIGGNCMDFVEFLSWNKSLK